MYIKYLCVHSCVLFFTMKRSNFEREQEIVAKMTRLIPSAVAAVADDDVDIVGEFT